jgi:hypothetical protein
MFVARVGRTARVPVDEIDPESALASATEMIANHQIQVAMTHPSASGRERPSEVSISHHSSV